MSTFPICALVLLGNAATATDMVYLFDVIAITVCLLGFLIVEADGIFALVNKLRNIVGWSERDESLWIGCVPK